MKKIREILITIGNAARYSFAFCLRNNKKDTIMIGLILLAQTILAYGMIMLTGKLISTVQVYLMSTKPGELTVNDFMQGEYYVPIILFIGALFLEIILQKYKSYVTSRQRHILRVSNVQEMNAFKASLDIGRRRSKTYDDLEKKIDELPDSWFTRVAFAGETMDFIGAIVTFVVFGTSLLMKHYEYVCILIVSSIPMVFAEFAAVNRSWKQSLELAPHNKKRSVLQGAFYGTTSFLQGVMFNQIPTLSMQIRESQDYVIKTMDRMRWINLQITLGAYVIAMVGFSTVLILCIYNTLSVRGDIGALTVVITSSRQLQSSIRDIVLQIANHWQSVKGTIMIEEEYFGMKPLLATDNPVKPEFESSPVIWFDNVSFSYPDTDALVLKGVSFTIEPGSKTVIIGKNGSGKSSLIGLLLRHYDPTSGNVRVGNINLRNIKSEVWSEYVCALLQNFTVMDRQVGAEIASSRLDQPIDMEKVHGSAVFAGFDSVMEGDPRGYDSQIGTEFGGREFSGGEEQRLALARARYRNTPIFILDEPDAKLDPEAAQRLIDNVFALKGVTVIIVTQHISRAIHGDKVIVLNQGEIAETGTHSELMSLNGRYASMFAKDKNCLGG